MTTECTDTRLLEVCNYLCSCYESINGDAGTEPGIKYTIISDNLYFENGERINKWASLRGFTQLACWLVKGGAYFKPAEASIPDFVPGCNETMADFCKALCICFDEFEDKFSRQEGFDPEDKVIFDPEDKVIFDPEDKVIFDAGDTFMPPDGIEFTVNDIKESLYDSYGNRINKYGSLDTFRKLIVWLLKCHLFDLTEAPFNITGSSM